jgi:cytochrome c-type protein NapB
MTHEEIAVALIGYKNGTYGGAMKNLMKAQVEKYSDDEIRRFASTIGKNEAPTTSKHNESNQTNAALKMNEGACTGCHGSDWGKIALEKSRNVSKMTHEEIAAALIGYKNGTYGGAMKNLMKAQVEKYSDDEIRRFSNAIGK